MAGARVQRRRRRGGQIRHDVVPLPGQIGFLEYVLDLAIHDCLRRAGGQSSPRGRQEEPFKLRTPLQTIKALTIASPALAAPRDHDEDARPARTQAAPGPERRRYRAVI